MALLSDSFSVPDNLSYLFVVIKQLKRVCRMMTWMEGRVPLLDERERLARASVLIIFLFETNNLGEIVFYVHTFSYR